MTIALDLDGVIVEWADIPKEQRCREAYDKLPPIAGAINGLNKLCWGHEVFIITARHYPGAFVHILNWLIREAGLDWQDCTLIAGVPTSSKWRVYQAIDADIAVDDNPRAFEKLPPRTLGILFHNPLNQGQWPLEVSNWQELMENIKNKGVLQVNT